MSSSKLRKISKIVKEIAMQNSQSRYDISGLDLSLCKFYYRTPQNLFKDLASGDYTIDTSSGQQSLVIQNDTVLQTGESIQVCYNMDLTSSKYVVDFEIDINKLTTSYNELVEDVHTLWEYIRKTGMIADDTTIDLILPQLNNNEVWVKSEDGYKGMPLDDVEQSIKDIIDKYSQQKIEEIKREVTTHVDSEIQRATNEITDVKDTSIQNIKDQEKTSTNNMISEINKHTEKKKVELNDHEQLKEQELNDLHEQLSTRLQELIDGAVMDKGVLPINSDWHLLDRGNYYVTDLFNSNYKNHPINIVNQNEGQGIVMVGIADDGKTKIIRYYSTSKRMFFQVLTQSNVWSEWAVVGGGNGTFYEIVQNNHGFNFNAVSLDGLTSRWVLADKNTGADAVAIKIDDNRFQLLFNGQGVIPTSSRDDKGNEFIYDEYYFLSNTVNGAFQKDKPTYGLFQPLFHTRMVENKLVADVQIGDIHDLTQHIVDSETIKEYGIATEKDLLNKLDKGNVSSEYDTAEKIEYQIKKLQANTIEDLIAMRFLKVGDIVELLGYYTAGDGAGHKRIIKAEDDGSGVQLSNNLWACIVHNGEVNVSWFGAKGDGVSSDVLAIKKANDYLDNLKGGILNFEDGTYLIDTFEIDISNRGGVGFGAFECKSNVSYIGNKNTILKVKDNVNNENFVFQAIFVEKKNSLSNINFKNIIFDLNGHKNHMQSKFYSEHYACGAIYTFYPENITIDNCIFKNCPGLNYIALGYVNKAIITNNKFLESADVIDGNIVRDHSSILLFGTNATVTDNYLKNSKRSKVATAIEVNSSESIISNNYANGYKVGMITANVGDIPVKDVLISENIFENNSKTFELWSAKDNVIENIKFFNNIATQNGKTSSGFMLDFLTNNKGTIRNLFISNNNFIQDNDGQGEYSLFSIYLGEDIENVFINNNSFYNNSGSAIAMYKGCNNIKITNNIFDNCLNTNSPYVSGAIIIQADSGYIDNVLIKDNTIKLATKNSIYVGIFLDHDCRNIKIINNIIYGEQFIFANTLNTKGIDNNIIYLEHFLFETTSKNITYPCSIGSKIYTKEGYNFVKKVNDLEIAYWNKEFYKNIGIQYVQSISGDIAFNERPTKETPWAWVYTTSTWEPVYFASAPLRQLSTNYMTDKMKQEGVYSDYISYMDEKITYDKQQRKLEQDRQLAYEEALKENPDLTYEGFMSLQPMTLNLVEEPQPSQALQEFMEKYL